MTEFQKRVLSVVARIPRGRITTYAAIARAIGSPRAVRAVGTAVGKNPHAPRVPCHRVVLSDGRLGNYAFGVARKTELLRREGIEISKGKVLNFNKKFKAVYIEERKGQ